MSAGGSSLVAYMMALGILMNISRQSRVSVLTLMNSVEMKYVERSV
jgi:cell division protein FtsW (lipid II flippase)